MSLALYFHPLSSYCHKVLIALYENGTPFTPHKVDLLDEAGAAAFKTIWPIGKFPVLHDGVSDRTIAESSIIIEYLAQHFPGQARLIPADPDKALQVRMHDRFFDLHVHNQMQKIVGDRLRPSEKKDPHGVEEARKLMQTALGMADKHMATNTWLMGDEFTMADCSAAPALFYANMVSPLDGIHKNVVRYLDRLMQRPSYARALAEAKPYLDLFPR